MTDQASLQTQKIQLIAIFTCIAIYGLTLGLGHPLLSLILESRGYDRTIIGLNAATPAIGMLLAAPAIPFMVRKFGLKYFLLGCFFADLVLFLMYPLFDNIYAWFAIRLFMGASTNALMITSEAWINSLVKDENRGRVMGLYTAIMAATIALGPAVIPFTGIDGWTPFLAGAFFISLAIVPLSMTSGGTIDVHTESSFGIISFLKIAPIIVFACLLFSWKEFAFAALLPVYGVRSGMDTSTAAIMLTAAGLGAVFLTYPIGWLADKFNRILILIVCGFFAMLGALLLPFVINIHYLLWPFLFLWGGVFVGLYTLALTLIGQHFKGNELVTATVAIGVIWGIGSLTGPSIVGAAMDIWDPHGFAGVIFVASFLFIIFTLFRWGIAKDKSNVI